MSISVVQRNDRDERMPTSISRCHLVMGGWAPVGHQPVCVRPSTNPLRLASHRPPSSRVAVAH